MWRPLASTCSRWVAKCSSLQVVLAPRPPTAVISSAVIILTLASLSFGIVLDMVLSGRPGQCRKPTHSAGKGPVKNAPTSVLAPLAMMRRLWDRVASRRIAALLAIFLVSLTISLIISGLGFFVRYGESVTYTQYARDLLSGHVDTNLYYRTPGYPILLILTGAMAGSFAGLLTAQAVAGAMISAASYWAVERFSWQVAFLVAGFSIGLMVPFIYINLLYPDEAYIVLLVLSCVFLVRWLAFPDASRINLYALAAASDLLAWMRPIGLTVTGTCLLLAALAASADGIPWLVCVIAIGGVHLGWHLYKVHHTWRGEDNASMLGRQLFFKAYMWSDGQEAGFSPDQGPATVALRRRIVEFFADKERKAEIEKRWGAIRQWTAPMSDEAYKEMLARFVRAARCSSC